MLYQLIHITMLQLEKPINPRETVASNQKEDRTAGKGAKIVRSKSQNQSSLKFSRKSSLPKDEIFNYKKQHREWDDHGIHYIRRENNQLQLSRCTTAEFMSPVFQAPKLQTPSPELSLGRQEKINNLQSINNQQRSNVFQSDSPTLFQCSFDQMLSYKMKVSELQQTLQKLKQVNGQLNNQLRFFDQVGQFIMEREAYISEITSQLQSQKIQIERLLSDQKQTKKELKELTRELHQQQYFLQQSVANICNQKTQFETVIKSELQLSKQIGKAEQRNIIIRQQNALNCNNPQRKTKPKCPTNKIQFQNISYQQNNVKSNDYLRTPSIDVNNGQQCTQTDFHLSKRVSLSQKSDYPQKATQNHQQIVILQRKKMNTDKLIHQNHQLRKRNNKLMRKIKIVSQKANSNEFCSDSELDLSFSPQD